MGKKMVDNSLNAYWSATKIRRSSQILLEHIKGQSPEIQSDDDEYDVVPVHNYPKLILQTADLINAQWPRSQMARVVTLQSSCDNLPCNLIVTKMKHKVVVGHLKITPIPSDRKSCFIESVVVAKCYRGQGIGSLLMERAESYCRDKGIETIYLSTYDQQRFYSRLGYDICEPINIFGNRSFVRNSTTKKTYMKKLLT
ncbi:N-alpha-acetyltransferase 80 [Culicoides brevitarsis]|uniref:N-alpha-acetyltransferase 80 n=1 Tax=Culicoides brevitarsis TaxID=469753 RepID=UPI00307B446E